MLTTLFLRLLAARGVGTCCLLIKCTLISNLTAKENPHSFPLKLVRGYVVLTIPLLLRPRPAAALVPNKGDMWWWCMEGGAPPTPTPI